MHKKKSYFSKTSELSINTCCMNVDYVSLLELSW